MRIAVSLSIKTAEVLWTVLVEFMGFYVVGARMDRTLRQISEKPLIIGPFSQRD